MSLKLGVNIDHVATLRQARGTHYPSPVEAARLVMEAGAHGITLHLREDRRHIQDADLPAVQDAVSLPINLEMANSREILGIALKLRPAEACLVPERREELTTEGGLDAAGQFRELEPTVKALRDAGICVSLFIEAAEAQIEAAHRLGVPCIELHTGHYCDAPTAEQPAILERLIAMARKAHDAGLRVNAGHGLNVENVGGLLRVPHLDTLNIGHSIVARAVFVGLREAVREMMEAMAGYQGGEP